MAEERKARPGVTEKRGPGADVAEEQGPRPDLGSIFLGPKGENAQAFERLLLEAFRDHIFWRRNFHPEDGFLIRETERGTPAFEHSISVLSEELLGLLAELKAGVPFFSPRYVGHMASDLTMASLIGYFAAMLYNPNNVAAEASPVTTRMELEVAAQFAAMFGYDADRQWGHLTSGGTVANFEALWVARNLKYLPVAIRWAADELGVEDVPVRRPDGSRGRIAELDLWGLLNLRPEDTLDAAERLRSASGDAEKANDAVGRHSMARLGYQEFGHRLFRQFGDALSSGVVLVPSTAHYSWEKHCRALGIGSAQLVHVPVDDRFRMDVGALESTLREMAACRQPVIACISVIGTTEESAVDRLHEVVKVRERIAREENLAFYLHADAAWGGYAASLVRAGDGSRRSHADVVADVACAGWPEAEVYHGLCALESTDSVTVDPHKLGFVPYPAGAVSFRDRRVRELVAVEAPYLFHRGASEWGYIGRYIFEGSKPGAAAAGVWMSHKVLPLNEDGYGYLIGETARGAITLHEQISAADWGDFRVVPLPRPDLNIVCFAISHPSLDSLAAINAFCTRVYQAMSVSESRDARQIAYFVTKTLLKAESYGTAIASILEALGVSDEEYREEGGLSVIRCTVMDPFLASGRGSVDFVAGFIEAMRTTFAARLSGV